MKLLTELEKTLDPAEFTDIPIEQKSTFELEDFKMYDTKEKLLWSDYILNID